MKHICCLFLSLSFAGTIFSQNPVINNCFTADPTARVFEGKLYMYPSHDIVSPVERLKEWFCMEDYHVYSSDNLIDWTDHGIILSQDDVPWVEPESYSMWAPDCVFKNGKYYFYFPSQPKGEKGFTVGVAVSDKPAGPFTPYARPIDGIKGIDPCVLTDSNGESYIYWSGRGLQVARLKDNMSELATEPKLIEGLPEGFKEGPFAFERNGKFYLTFPWVKKTTETLAYAMSDSPMGPFEFKGIIMDESPTGCWTNHHSIVEYKGQWYLFYHHNDYSPQFDKNRSVRIDSLSFNDDGTIRKVLPTLRGVGITDARSKIQVDRYSAIESGVNVLPLDSCDRFKGWKACLPFKGAWLRYDKVDFGKKVPSAVRLRVKSCGGGVLGIAAGEKKLAVADIPSGDWQVIDVPVHDALTGVQNLQISLSKGKDAEIDWLSFVYE